MNYKKLGTMLLILALFVMPGVLASPEPQETLTKIPINTCTGSGDLYVYTGDQFQDPDTSFTVDNDELLIFTKSNRVSSIMVDGNTPDVIYDEKSPFHAKVYRIDVTPGSTVNVDFTNTWHGARGVQGFFVQDSSNPVYDVVDFELTYSDSTNIVYLKPGTYQYVIYDKYDKYNDGSDDSGKVTMTITGPLNTVISDTTYTKPSPTGTQGAIVHEFTVSKAGYYKVDYETEDSTWWVLFDCEPKKEDFCRGADAIIPVDLVVVGDDCHHSDRTTDSEMITIPDSKQYYMTGVVKRGDFSDYPDNCQDNEAFYAEINGQQGPTVADDPASCTVFYGEEYIGTFDLEAGDEVLSINTVAACPPDDSPESVHMDYVCLYGDGDNEVPEFGLIGAIVAAAAIAGFVIYKRKN